MMSVFQHHHDEHVRIDPVKPERFVDIMMPPPRVLVARSKKSRPKSRPP